MVAPVCLSIVVAVFALPNSAKAYPAVFVRVSVEIIVSDPLGVVTVYTEAAWPSTTAAASSVILVRSVETSSVVCFQLPYPLLLENDHFPPSLTYAQSEYVVLTPNMYC